MGVQSSKSKRHSSHNSCSSSSSGDDDEVSSDYSIPYDLLVDVLSYVPSNDLIKHCRLVCKLWKDIIDGHGVWKLKCERENKIVPKLRFENLPLHYYRLIYLHNPYGTNLIRNPFGEESFNHWEIRRNGGFVVENPPNGADPVPIEVGSSSCFATSYYPCQKFQIVDIVKSGIHPEVMNLPTTKIEIGEWWAARFDCASRYILRVILLNSNFNLEIGNYEEAIVDEFNCECSEIQWAGREWHKVSHVFEDVKETHYVYFDHTGKDDQFWAGNYGSKMTGAFVKVIA